MEHVCHAVWEAVMVREAHAYEAYAMQEAHAMGATHAILGALAGLQLDAAQYVEHSLIV